ncbi:MAG: phage portal protein [Caldisericum sp.]
MGILDFFKKKSYEVRSEGIIAGILTNDLTDITSAFFKNPYLYRAVTLRAQTLGALEWKILVGDKEHEKYTQWFKNPMYLTPTQFIEKIQMWRDLIGVAFVRKSFPQMELLDADRVSLIITPNSIKVLYMRPFQTDTYDISEVAIITSPSPLVRIIKDNSAAQTVFDAVKLNTYQTQVMQNILQNGTFLSLILTTEDRLNPEQIENLRLQIQKRYASPQNSGKVMLLTGGRWGITQAVVNPANFGIEQISELTKDQVAVAFAIPNVFMNDMQGVNKAVAQTQEYIFEKYVIRPLADDLAEQFTRQFFPDAEFKFVYTQNLSLEDQQLLAQIDDIRLKQGYTYVNELRARDGLEPLPWGNSFWGNLSMVPLQSVNPESKLMRNIEEKITKLIDEKLAKIQVVKDVSTNNDLIWKDYVAMTEPQEKRLEKEILNYFKKQEKYVLNQLEKFKSVKKASVDLSEILDITLPDEWIDFLVKELKPFILAFMQQAGDKVLSRMGFSASFNLQVPKIQEHIEKSLRKSALEMTNTTRDDLARQLIEGVNNGESIDQLASRVKTLFEETYKNRAKTIARTETISATNYAQLEAGEQFGARKKIWITALDERTRPAHAEANGQVVNIDEPFIVDGEELMYPGDKNGSPENIINCRCTIGFSRGEE